MITERIKLIRKYFKLSQTDFGERLGKTLRMVQYYESGERNIDDGVFFRLQEVFGVNPSWLRTGVGEMFNKVYSDIQSSRTEPAKELMVCVRYFPEVKASAGFGSFVNDETSEDYWLYNKGVGNPKYRAIINVIGDSMAPALLNNDKILIDTDTLHLKRLKPQHLYVIHTEGMVIIKRFIKRQSNICTFRSDNKFYKDIEIDLSDEHNKIVGIPLKIVCRELQEPQDEDFIEE